MEHPAPPCPRCRNNKHVHRSGTHVWYKDWLMMILGRRPYRCHSCGQRFYGRG
ncbi:MAG TPA: hypothetical protein VMU19_14755 [Bryobacteraceae bacterium]|nr:hypothetical protein [Bryobacteraceae bacterium]